MSVELDDQQLNAIKNLKNGSILNADVGTGKSRTAIGYYYFKVCRGSICVNGKGSFKKMKEPRDLYILTTAKKRDSIEWDKELASFLLFRGENKEQHVNIVIDSWNNIQKYRGVFGAFFIFDEQRVKGSGAWVKSFYQIAKKNRWILLSATPGDTWQDYIPVFVANGFYRNKSDFNTQHVRFARFAKYPKIEGYYNEGILLKHKMDITVTMTLKKEAVKHYIDIWCDYDRALYRRVWRDRLDPYENEPIEETGDLYFLLRRVVNTDASRLDSVRSIFERHKKVIIFYNFTIELELLRELFTGLGIDIGEWNGQVHSGIPRTERWAYLVQYIAGCEGWNCTETDTMIFFSQSYSYSQTVQAEGRIDRRDTPFSDLYYYKLKSHSPIDLAIARALKNKENFNEKTFLKGGK